MTKKPMKKKELHFICNKCEHHLFVDEKPGWVEKLTKRDCPNCGEESGELWIIVGYGKYKDFIYEK